MLIGIDMDGVLARFTKRAIENAASEFNVVFTEEEVVSPPFAQMVWEKMPEGTEKLKWADNPNRMYELICPRGFFEELEPYEGAVDAVKALYNCGHQIVIITKPLEWANSTQEKMRWLRKHFSDIQYSVIMVGSVDAKAMVDVDVMIDDDPRVIKAFADKYSYHGVYQGNKNDPIASKVIVIDQPWNQNIRPYIKVTNIKEVPKRVREIEIDQIRKEE